MFDATLKTEQAEAALARAQRLYDEAESGSDEQSCPQLLLAEEKALEQVRGKELLQQHAAAGVLDNHGVLGICRNLSVVSVHRTDPVTVF